MSTPSLPHSALVHLTGWATAAERGVCINGVFVRTAWRPDGPQRVTLKAFPRTTLDGTVKDLFAPARAPKPARTPNGTRLTVTGQLLKLDLGLGLIRVKVCPAVARCTPFMVTLHASREVLKLDPATFHVTATGRLLTTDPPVLLAEDVVPVYAPIPHQWHRWRPKRRRVVPFPLPSSSPPPEALHDPPSTP